MGEFEQMVLLAVLRLSNEAYGMEIRKEIENRTRRPVSYGAVYTALDRLQRKGFVSNTLGEVTSERGGRAKKYFTVETAGREALRRSHEAMAVMWKGVSV